MRGRIEAIDDTKSVRFKTVTIDGTKYGVPSSLVKNIGIEDKVIFEFEQKEKYKNITDIIPDTSEISVGKPEEKQQKLTQYKTYDAMKEAIEETKKLVDEYPNMNLDWSKICVSMFIQKVRNLEKR